MDKMFNSKKIILIIPAYNESEGIVDVIQKVDQFRSIYNDSSRQLDYVVINDGSTDNEEEILLSHQIEHIELIQNLGIGGAVQTGYLYAEKYHYDIAVQFDGDGQHDLKYLNKLIEPIKEGQADLCVGSRFLEKESDFQSTFMRRVGIKIIKNLIRIFTGKKVIHLV